MYKQLTVFHITIILFTRIILIGPKGRRHHVHDGIQKVHLLVCFLQQLVSNLQSEFRVRMSTTLT